MRGHNYLSDLAARINAEHDAAEEAQRRGLAHAINAGKLLLEAKEQVKHGQWGAWLKQNCRCSERTAQLYMRVARNEDELSKSATVADLTLRGAAQVLGKPGPDEALDETGIYDAAPSLRQLSEKDKAELRRMLFWFYDSEPSVQLWFVKRLREKAAEEGKPIGNLTFDIDEELERLRAR